MVEALLLGAVKCKVRGVDVEDDLVGLLRVVLMKQLHQEVVHLLEVGDDLAGLVAIHACGRQFQAVQRALARQGLAVLALALQAPQHRTGHGILAELLVVVEVFKTGQETRDALAHQGAHLVDHQLGMPRIVEARRHTLEVIQESLGKAGEQETAMGGDGAAREVGFDAPWPGAVRGWAGWSAATVSSAATICFIAAFKNTAVANVAIIYVTAPFAAAAIAWMWMRETPGLATLVAAGLCVAGVTVMVGGSAGSPDLTGDMLALGMTVLMALMMVIMRRHPDRPMTLAVGPISCLQLVAASWLMGAQFDVSSRELVMLAGFGVVHAAATVLLAEGVLRIRAAEAALLGALEMPLAPLWGWLILFEIPRMPTFAGGAVVLATLAWFLVREARARS